MFKVSYLNKALSFYQIFKALSKWIRIYFNCYLAFKEKLSIDLLYFGELILAISP